MDKQKQELSMKDVEFLQAVRHIEDNPSEFQSVGEDGRATTEAINTVLMDEWDTVGEWSNRKISYRMNQPGKGDGSRGWGVDAGFGLVRLFEAELDPEQGWTSRKVELTEKGRNQLSVTEDNMGISRSADEGDGMSDLDSSAKEVELRLTKVEEQLDEYIAEVQEAQDMLESVASDVNTFKESESGALSGQMEEQLGEVFTRIVRHTRVNKSVLGVDTEPFSADADPSDEDYRRARKQIREVLLSGTDDSEISEAQTVGTVEQKPDAATDSEGGES